MNNSYNLHQLANYIFYFLKNTHETEIRDAIASAMASLYDVKIPAERIELSGHVLQTKTLDTVATVILQSAAEKLKYEMHSLFESITDWVRGQTELERGEEIIGLIKELVSTQQTNGHDKLHILQKVFRALEHLNKVFLEIKPCQ